MKKLVFIFGLLLTACSTNIVDNQVELTVQQQVDMFITDNNLNEIDWNCDISTNKIVEFSMYNDMFITDSGKLYQSSIQKPFSNLQNCKLIDSDVNFKRFINNIIISEENEYYYFLDNSLEKGRARAYTGQINYDSFDKNNSSIIFGYGTELLYAFIEGNVIELHDLNGWTGKILNTFTLENENIKHAYNNIILTDKNVYQIAYQESKFADTDGQFILEPIEYLYGIFDDIQFYKPDFGRFIIFKSKPEKIYIFN